MEIMSRFICTKNDDDKTEVAYGLDHALGWFYQEFDENGDCTRDLDSLFTQLGRAELVHRLEQTDADPRRIAAIQMDLDPATVG
jgi:hypothetical protein